MGSTCGLTTTRPDFISSTPPWTDMNSPRSVFLIRKNRRFCSRNFFLAHLIGEKKYIILNKYYTFHFVLYSQYKPTVLVLPKQLHTYISLLLHKHYVQILRKNTDLKDEYVDNINAAINHQAKVTTIVVKLAVRCFFTFLFRAVCKNQAKTNRRCT